MGIYDREYTRREGPSFLGSWGDSGAACKWLIGVTVLLFLANLMTTDTRSPTAGPLIRFLSLDVEKVVEHGQVWRLVTYAFVEEPTAIFPIVFNMLFLWWFGRDLEGIYGPREMLFFYLAATLIGGVAYVLTSLALGVRQQLWMPTYYVGSVGPVIALLTLCALHFPSRIIRLFFLIPVPIWLLVVLTVAFDTFLLFGVRLARPAVTLSACGFALAYGKYQWRLSSWQPSFPSFRRARRPRLRVYREEEPSPVSVSAGIQSDEEQLEAKIDAILEKISRVGKDNLTESEQQLLMRASEVFRRRRS